MSKIDIKRVASDMLDGRYFSHTTPAGLSVYVYEMTDKSAVSAQLAVGFGSSMVHVTDMDGSRVKLPAGTAHFLEHKLFERNGEDAFSLFAELGSSSNAYTTFGRTTFVFRSGSEYETPLKILLDFFRKPMFTSAGVEKEKQIISDEIRMYLDDPGWIASFNLFRGLYRNIGINEDIAGSLSSIRDINRELISDCFSSFYRPGNMALTVAGNVEHMKVFDIADGFMPENAPVPRYSICDALEPQEIFETHVSEKMTVSLPLFDIGFKESAYPRFRDIRNDLLMDMILDLTAGESTEFFRSMYEQNLINDSFGSGFYSGDDYLCTYFEGDSLYPEKVRDCLMDRIDELKRTGFDPVLFDERVRTSVGSYISIFDNPGSVAGSLMSCHFKKANLYDIIQLVGDPDISEAEDLLRSCFDPGCCCLSVVSPNSSGDM